MKNYFIIFLISFLPQTVSAQTYHPFPDTNAIWNYANYYDINPDKTIQIFISGDSMIGDTNYHKLFVSYDQDSMPNSQMYLSFTLIREDSFKKVFIRDQDGERILYDFSLGIGDSINYAFAGYTLFITAIDSVLILNKYRKRFLNNVGEYWIEGIGSLQGLTQNAYPHLGDDIYLQELVCFTENDTLMYLNSIYTSCYPIITEIPENDLQDGREINIFPNPVINELNVIKIDNETTEIILYDIALKRIIHQKFENLTSLNVERLSKGVYIYELRDKDKIIKGKIIKE